MPTTTKKKTTTNKPETGIKQLEKKLNSYLKNIMKGKDLDEIKDKAMAFISDKKSKAKAKIQETEKLIKKHPTASLVIAAVTGAGLAAILSRKKKKSKKK